MADLFKGTAVSQTRFLEVCNKKKKHVVGSKFIGLGLGMRTVWREIQVQKTAAKWLTSE